MKMPRKPHLHITPSETQRRPSNPTQPRSPDGGTNLQNQRVCCSFIATSLSSLRNPHHSFHHVQAETTSPSEICRSWSTPLPHLGKPPPAFTPLAIHAALACRGDRGGGNCRGGSFRRSRRSRGVRGLGTGVARLEPRGIYLFSEVASHCICRRHLGCVFRGTFIL